MKTSILIFFVIGFTSCVFAQQPDTSSIPAVEFRKLLVEKQCILIDARTPEEYAKESIEGALNINVKAEDFLIQIGKLDRNKFYFIYCGIGKRGSHAMELMTKEGFKQVRNLYGGLTSWKQENLPVVTK